MNESKNFKNVAIYIRVSTEEQATEGYSISAQKQRLKAFCIAQDWQIAGIYADEGLSAKDMNRPDLQRMLRDINKGKVDCVLVWRLDRLTRSVLDLYRLLEVFESNECRFKSATEVFDTTTAMGRMFITIVAAIAQWERENTGERISMGYAEKARQGKYPLNFRPFGYNLNLKTGKLTVNVEEAEVVKTIYDMYNNGYGANRICQFLNRQGITTRKGNTWNDKPLMKLLKNPLYTGSIRWKNQLIRDTHKAIISDELFERTQKLIMTRKNQNPRRVSSSFIFSGKLKCSGCGSLMVSNKTYHTTKDGERITYNYYRCNKVKTGQCKGSTSLSEFKLEAAFLKFITSIDYEKQLQSAVQQGEKTLNESTKRDMPDKETLMNEISKIENRRKKWQYAWSNDDISDIDFRKRMQEAKEDEEKIKKQLDDLIKLDGKESEQYSKEEIFKALKNISLNWKCLENEEKKQLIDEIAEELHYTVKSEKGKVNHIEIEGIDYRL